MSHTEHAYFTVVTSGSTQELEAYLYSHTTIIFRISQVDAGRRHFLLETAGTAMDREQARDAALRLAQYQADRISSGLMGASRVYDIKADAINEHYERVGVMLVESEEISADGVIDLAEFQRAMRLTHDFGVVPTAEGSEEGRQAYIRQDSAAIVINGAGEIYDVTFAGAGSTSVLLGIVSSMAAAVSAFRQAYEAQMLREKCEGLQAYLEEHIPSGVAHYAVEDLRRSLRQILMTQHEIDFNYGLEVVDPTP